MFEIDSFSFFSFDTTVAPSAVVQLLSFFPSVSFKYIITLGAAYR